MSIQKFYDELAATYHLIFEDWDRSIARQSRALRVILRERGWKGRHVLDLACGIGTQALGLSKSGLEVTASDLSPASVQRARQEARKRGLKLRFKVADMRRAYAAHGSGFELAMAMDNAVPHLLSDGQILKAFRSARACLIPGGIYMISVRDYAKEPSAGLHLIPYGTRGPKGGETTLFQVWSFRGPLYDVSFFRQKALPSGRIRTSVLKSTYYAIRCERLMRLMREAGFEKVERIDGLYYQPVLLGRR